MRQTPLLAEAPEEAVSELSSAGVARSYAKGTYLFLQHDEAATVYFLWDGRVEITTSSVTGSRQLHTTIEPPQFFGELGVLGDMPRTATALAVEDTTAVAIPAEAFLGFVEQHPTASRALLRALARQIASHEGLIEDLLYLDLKGRVAKRLLGLVSSTLEDLPADGAVIPSDITHSDLAGLSGGSRENVTRILSEFQRREFISRNGKRYVLRDVRALAQLAGL